MTLAVNQLVAGARLDLGLPVRGGGPSSQSGTEQADLPSQPSDFASQQAERWDAEWRPNAVALADAANGTSNISSSNVGLTTSDQRDAHRALTDLFVEAAAYGSDSMPAAPRTVGNTTELLDSNPEFLPRVYQDIENATDSIVITQFSWRFDGQPAPTGASLEERLTADPSQELLDLLCRKAREGVDVRVLMDGGNKANGHMREALEAAGATFAEGPGSPRPGGLGNDHRKMVIVDDRVMYSGGLGFGTLYNGDEYNGWVDLMTRVEGPAAAVGTVEWLSTWEDQHGLSTADSAWLDRLRGQIQGSGGGSLRGAEILREAGLPVNEDVARGAVTVLSNRVGSSLNITEAFLRDAAAAKDRLWVSSTYITNEEAARALEQASLRGVDVRLLVSPEGSRDWRELTLGRTLYDELTASGVEIYEAPGVAHSKSWLMDDTHAVVGSMNLSRSSLERSEEFSVLVEDRSFQTELEDFFLKEQARSTVIQPEDVDGTGLKILDWFLDLVNFPI